MRKLFMFAVALSWVTTGGGDDFGGLYPRESVSREVKSLDGIWGFRLAPVDDPDQGFRDLWFEQPLKLTGDTILMPVPCSYNDVTQSKELRDHVGWAWYDREFFVPSSWLDGQHRVVVRVGSAHYNSIMYINGVEVTSHEFGHLPFSAEVSGLVVSDKPNLITIAINNTLNPLTIPQGEVVYKNDPNRYPAGYFTLSYDFDFFNYAGIHRPVFLHTTPTTYIDDVAVSTNIVGGAGVISYNVSVQSTVSISNTDCTIEVYNEEGSLVDVANSCVGQISIDGAKLWWPYLMAADPGYMYTLKINVTDSEGRTDVYPQRVGIRTIGWNSTTLTLNDVPVYLRGCGKHEDADIIGKGVSYPLIVKDFNLLKWLGANSFRTSHYPYAEEIMDMADEEGIMIIDECSAVNLENFGDELLSKHKTQMEAIHRRDKNRPSVILWSVANEPRSDNVAAESYFQQISDFVRELDPSRPVTAAISQSLTTDLASASFDVLMLNKYYGWYSDTGHLEVIEMQTITEFTNWFNTYNKPLMISEYGASTIPGIHFDPAFTWSEEYQAQLLIENFKAFDTLRQTGFFFGEMIWNFADFATAQGTTRVGGNKKGIFTRERQPKLAAHLLRERYNALANNSISSGVRWNQIFL